MDLNDWDCDCEPPPVFKRAHDPQVHEHASMGEGEDQSTDTLGCGQSQDPGWKQWRNS